MNLGFSFVACAEVVVYFRFIRCGFAGRIACCYCLISEGCCTLVA